MHHYVCSNGEALIQDFQENLGSNASSLLIVVCGSWARGSMDIVTTITRRQKAKHFSCDERLFVSMKRRTFIC